MFPRWGEHISLGICVSQIGGTHIPRVTCFPGRGTHITRDMCFEGGGSYITRVMCFPGRGTHITSGRTIRKVMGGRGIFEPQDFFFCYQIPCMNFFSAIA